ncbi:uncharacterized protein A4U43_C02F16880 [Asparagus officinalis]|uniref:Uncharacterized protein n=1 Tax=Asparagus officinalis TaxID=4686 RepID=A0A5P1FJK3_ASPOF|nr:uncharacterized protein A4U43_C02F16880 [Asparagus officinalis]
MKDFERGVVFYASSSRARIKIGKNLVYFHTWFGVYCWLSASLPTVIPASGGGTLIDLEASDNEGSDEFLKRYDGWSKTDFPYYNGIEAAS